MRIYLSGRLRLRGQLRLDRETLLEAGHVSTARWLDDVGGEPAAIAARDFADIDKAAVIILRGHCGRNGGLMAEVGYGLAKGKRVIHVASERDPREAFLWADGVVHVRSFREALDVLKVRPAVAA